MTEKEQELFERSMKYPSDSNNVTVCMAKQIQVEPVDIQDEFGDFILSCARCTAPVTNYWAPNHRPLYCQFCGQKLDRHRR